MRHFLLIGGMALACLAFSAARAAETSNTSYDGEPAAGESAADPRHETSMLLDSAAPGDCACDCCECECYDCCDSFNNRKRLLGFLPSDHCFDDFISPLSNPFFFEDPRSLTEVRGIFLNNQIPELLEGGNAYVYAAQLRGRVTDPVSIIVPRVAYMQVEQPQIPPSNGSLSTAVGFKYNFLRDVERQLLVTAGMTYFIKGSGEAISNFGDGDFHFFLTGGKEILERGHWLSASGFRIPADNNWGSQMWYWSNQWDYEVAEGIYPLLGVNWFHYMRSADVGVPAPVAGLDLLNFPAGGVAGTNVATGVVGGKWKPGMHCEVGAGYEFPLTERKDVLQDRLYVDFLLRY